MHKRAVEAVILSSHFTDEDLYAESILPCRDIIARPIRIVSQGIPVKSTLIHHTQNNNVG